MDPGRQRLTRGVLRSLQSLAFRARPSRAIKPSFGRDLERHGLVEVVMLPSPYAVHRGRVIEHLIITQAGTDYLQPDLLPTLIERLPAHG